MLMSFKNACATNFRAFHNEEEGVEAIQAVIILAVAAVAMLVVQGKWDAIKELFNTNTDNSLKFTP